MTFFFFRKNDVSDVVSKANVGQAISSYITCKWNCLRFMFINNSREMVPIDVSQVLDAAMEDLSIGSGLSDVAIYKALDVIMSEVLYKSFLF